MEQGCWNVLWGPNYGPEEGLFTKVHNYFSIDVVTTVYTEDNINLLLVTIQFLFNWYMIYVDKVKINVG